MPIDPEVAAVLDRLTNETVRTTVLEEYRNDMRHDRKVKWFQVISLFVLEVLALLVGAYVVLHNQPEAGVAIAGLFGAGFVAAYLRVRRT